VLQGQLSVALRGAWHNSRRDRVFKKQKIDFFASIFPFVSISDTLQFASTVNPSLPSQTGLPHARVAPGQDFQVEWVNGHDSDCYWVILPEKDHMRNLLKMNTAALEDYINNAPEDQKKSPELRYQKYHRKYNSLTLDNKAGDNFFLKVVGANSSDPNFMPRPVVFEGSMSGAPRTNTAQYNPNLVSMAYYHQNTACTMNDRRTQYTNPKYPAIIAVHRYRLCTGQASRPDVARLSVPKDAKPGRYVAWWSWRGYYDIVDFEVIAGPDVAEPYGKKVPAPPAGQPAQYKRVDHCVFPQAQPAGKCFRIVTDARACMDMCDRLTEFACHGVGIVPVVYPSAAYPGFRNISLAPFEFTATCNKGSIERNAHRNHLLCFAASAREKTETLDRMYITDDPDDPAFYSTCLIRIPFKDTAAGPVVPVAREPQYMFGKQCISCDQAKASTVERALMVWNITTNCTACEIEQPDFEDSPVPARLVAPDFNQTTTPWAGRLGRAFCRGLNEGSNFSANYVCPNATVNCIIGLNPPGASSLDMSERDCQLLAQNDPRCGRWVFMRQRSQDPSSCWCMRGDGGDTPCCGACDRRNSTQYSLFNINRS
jgi:hypothetical protein